MTSPRPRQRAAVLLVAGALLTIPASARADCGPSPIHDADEPLTDVRGAPVAAATLRIRAESLPVPPFTSSWVAYDEFQTWNADGRSLDQIPRGVPSGFWHRADLIASSGSCWGLDVNRLSTGDVLGVIVHDSGDTVLLVGPLAEPGAPERVTSRITALLGDPGPNDPRLIAGLDHAWPLIHLPGLLAVGLLAWMLARARRQVLAEPSTPRALRRAAAWAGLLAWTALTFARMEAILFGFPIWLLIAGRAGLRAADRRRLTGPRGDRAWGRRPGRVR